MEVCIPKHIGIIMDGNRRWARERNLPEFEGHRKGLEKMLLSPQWFFSRGVKVLSFFVFSAKNWNRPADEINYLMKLNREIADHLLLMALEKGFCLTISGRISELPGDMPQVCQEATDKTKDGKNGTINICLNYGGREELVDAIKKMIKNKVEEDQIHEGIIKKYLYGGEFDDPELIIRLSGDERLSGFLLWQSAYSELLFLKKYWPDFEPTDVEHALNLYEKRKKS